MSSRETIARNTIFNGLGRAWEALAGLALTAYIVYRLGAADYGLWSVAAAFMGYAALLDVGLGSGYSKFIAEHAAKNEEKAVSEVVSTGFFFYLLFGGIFVAIGWPLVGEIFRWVGTWDVAGDLSSPEVLADMEFLLRWGLVMFALTNCLAPFTAVQTGLQRMGVTNLISFVCSLVKIAATVFFLESGTGVRGLLYANAVVLGVFGVMTVVAAFRLWPGLRVGPVMLSGARVKQLFSFGWQTQVSRLANLVMFETDILVITLMLQDLRLAGLYRLGVEIANKMRQGPVVLLSALVPAMSELDARDEAEKLRELYVRATKYVALVTLPLAAILLGCADFIMDAWQGRGDDWSDSAWVIRILAVGYIANLLPGAGITLVLGKGRPDIQMKAGLLSLSSNIVLTIALVLTIGFWGIPIATMLSMYLSWAWFVMAVHKVVPVPTSELLADSMRGALVASVPVLLFAFGANVFSEQLASRVQLLLGLMAVGAFCGLLYAGGLRRTGVLDERDLDFLDNTLRLKRVPGYETWSRPFRTSEP